MKASEQNKNSNILKLLNALQQVVFHFFTCLTTALVIGKVKFYPFEYFAHHLTLPSPARARARARTHTHTHTAIQRTHHLYTMCGCIFSSIKDIVTACWLTACHSTQQDCCSDQYCVVHCLYLTGNTLPYSRLCLFSAHPSGNCRVLKDKPPFPPTSVQLYLSLIFKICKTNTLTRPLDYSGSNISNFIKLIHTL
jgi:hypothetical protein